MGTIIAISADANSEHSAIAGIDAAFAVMKQVEALMHPTRIGSDLAAIHHALPGTPLALHPWTWEVLVLSRRLHRLSNEVFDPCLPGFAGRFSDLEFAPPLSVIAHRPVLIDLGGIAKGYAIDRALSALRAAGCRNGLVNAGGDVAAFGDRGHLVVIRDRDAGSRVVELKDAALATSDVCNPARPGEHRGYYHGVNRRPLSSGTVSIGAASAAIADALTKCVLAGDGEMTQDLLERFDAHIVAYEAYQ